MDEAQKTPEQLLEEKKSAFAANPNMFVSLDDVILGVVRCASGLMPVVGKCKRSEIEIAQSRVNLIAFKTYMHMEMLAQEEAQGKIITANKKGGIMNFARNGIK